MAKTLVYQLYPISWEKQGGLKAMAEHLEVINYLGADYVWLNPLYPSPRCDYGYDIADYQDIDSRLGTMADFDSFVKIAHRYGIGVIMSLVLNHTSINHYWFEERPEYYCWSEPDSPHHWKSPFNDSDAWKYDEKRQKYYLNLFNKNQADLNWFPRRDRINKDLVKEFQRIIRFWGEKHGVDGFHLSTVQAVNKDLSWLEIHLPDLIFGDPPKEVIKSVFQGSNDYFIIMNCLDPTYGGLTDFYYNSTPIDYLINISVKDVFSEDKSEFMRIVESASSDPGFMLALESHDSMRFPSRGISPKSALEIMFGSKADGICLYQGQELGLSTPANLALPLHEYKYQLSDNDSYLNLTKNLIDDWKTK